MRAGRNPKRHTHEPPSTESESKEERFDFAFFISLGIFAALFLIIFIPALGPLLVFILVPYLAGYQSGKFVNKSDGIRIALITGFIWSVIEVYIILSLLGSLQLAVAEPGLHTFTDWLLIVIIFVLNISFCTLGTIFSPRKKEEAEEEAES
jgi:quinol-cytochrome oxidoreductase complex cytochrome b subunit